MSAVETRCPDGQPVRVVKLSHASGMTLEVMDWGATWLSCTVPVGGVAREVLLAHATLEDFFTGKAYIGATVGRYCNRIAQSRFSRDGRAYPLVPNEGANQLHGGPGGFSARRWQVIEQGTSHVTFEIRSADGDQGFPGNCVATVSYRLEEGLRLAMDFTATVDAPCPVNLTNHAYFNLNGSKSDVLQHTLYLAAHEYLPIDAEAIPLGHFQTVKGSGFDFTTAKTVGRDLLVDEQQKLVKGYDHSFLIDAACRNKAAAAATLISGDGKLGMDLYTTKPAVQFYSGNHLTGASSRDGGTYAANQGLALETQYLPDSPNHPEWHQPDCWLKPGETYRHSTDLVFRPIGD